MSVSSPIPGGPAPTEGGRGDSPHGLFGPHPAAQARRIAILCLFPALVLVGTLRYDFVIDDNIVLLDDPAVVGQWSLTRVFGTQVRVADVTLGYYRPLTTLSYRLDRALWGTNPAGYHLTNLLLHVAVTLCVYAVARRTGARVETAWFAAMIFAVLPAHTEAIGWIQGRVDLLATTFVLLALWALLRAQQSPGAASWRWGGWGGVAFFLALLAKESAAPLPLAWAAWELAGTTRASARRGRACLARVVPLVLAFSAYWLLRHAVVGTGVQFPLSVSPLGLRLLALFRLLAEYGRILLIPDLGLNLHRVLRLEATPETVLLAALAALALGGGLAVAWHRARGLFPWVAWGPTMLAPPLLFVWYAPAPDLGFFTAERFLYLPSVGWCLLGGALLGRLLRWHQAAGTPLFGWATALGLLGAYAGLTLLRLAPWADPVELYRGMQAQVGQSTEVRLFIHNNLGGVYLDRGEFDAAGREFAAALSLRADYPFALNNMGVLLVRQGRPRDAVAWLERAIRLDPDYADAYANLGAAHEAMEDRAAARATYAAGLRRKPDAIRLIHGLARVGAATHPDRTPTRGARP